MSGRGEVWSFTTIHRPTLPAFEERVPYVALVVRLEEGPFLVSTLAEPDGATVHVGAPVELVLEHIDDELTVPTFRLADPTTS